MFLKLISPDGLLFQGDVSKVSVPTEQGVLCILPNHINLSSSLLSGDVVVYSSKEVDGVLDSFFDNSVKYPILGGIFMIKNNIITITSV